MIRYIIVIFLLQNGILAFGQVNNPCLPLGEDWCVDAPLINPCQLNGWQGDTDPPGVTYTPGDVPDRGWCNGDYTIENNQWLSFIAQDRRLALNVDISSCTNNRGIQIACYEMGLAGECPGQLLGCIGAQSGQNTSFVFNVQNLTVGTQYLLMIDGYAGDGCPFTLWLEAGSAYEVVAQASTYPICPGVPSSYSLSGAGSSFGSNFFIGWETTNGNIISGENTLYPLIDQPGDYTLTIYDLTTCCWATTTVNVPESIEFPEAFANASNIDCENETAVLSANGSSADNGTYEYEYFWYNEQLNNIGIGEQVEDITDEGTYTLIVYNLYTGCTTETTVEVEIDTMPPMANPEADALITCDEDDIRLSSNASSGSDYFWTGPNGFSSTTRNPNVDQPGVYELLLVGDNGCTSIHQIEVLTDTIAPDLTASTNLIDCINPEVQISASSSDPEAEFTWTAPDGITSNDASFLVSEMGDYLLIATSENGCTAEMIVFVEEDLSLPEGEVNSLGLLDCNTSSVQVQATLSDPDASFEWTGINGFSSNQLLIDVENPGEYLLTITGANGCSMVYPVMVEEDLSTPDISTLIPDILDCATLEVVLSGSSLDANVTYEWIGENGMLGSGAETTISEAGTYTLIVTGENGCTSESSIVVSQDLSEPIVDAGQDELLTCQDSQVSLDGSNSESGANMQYEWFNSGGVSLGMDPEVNVENPGTYTLVITNLDNGCSSSDEVAVNADEDLPIADAGIENTLNCLISQITLDGSNSSQGSTINYQWLDANNELLSTELSFQTDQAGLYTLIVEDSSNGCVSESQVLISENLNPPLADPGQADILNCDVTEIILDASNSAGGPDLSFEWQDLSGNVLSNHELLPVVLPGFYQVVVIDNENGCSSTEIIQVLEDVDMPIAEAGLDFTITCENTEAVLDASSSTGSNLIYTWTDENNNILSNDEIFISTIPGTYILSVLNTLNGCVDVDEIIVDEDADFPEINILEPEVITCDAQEVQLDASNSATGSEYTYEWYDENGILVGSDITINANLIGQYTLIVSNTLTNCSSTSSIEVFENLSSPEIDAGNPQTISCDVSSVVLNGSTINTNLSYSIEWQNSNGLSLGNSWELTVSNPDVYTLIVTNNTSGCSSIDFVEVVPDENIPVANTQVDQVLDCNNPEVMISTIGSSQGSNYNYSWTNNIGTNLGDAAELLVSTPGVYTLGIVDQNNGCSTESSIEIVEDMLSPLIALAEIPVLNCEIAEAILDASNSESQSNPISGIGQLLFEWLDEDGNILSTDANYTTTTEGTYTLFITDSTNGCTNSSVFVVLADLDVPVSDPGIPATLTCEYPEIVLDASNSTSGPNISLIWLNESDEVLSSETFFSIDSPGTYTLLVTNELNGCTSLNSVDIDIQADLPQVHAGPELILTCDETDVLLDGSASDAGPNISYVWTNSNGDVISTEVQTSVQEEGVYSLTVYNAETGCSSSQDNLVLQNIDSPSANAGEDLELTCTETSFILSAENSSQGTQYVYQWFNAAGIDLGEEQNVEVFESGIYNLIVTDLTNGCTSMADVEIYENTEVPQIELNEPEELNCDLNSTLLSALGSTSFNTSHFWTDPAGIILSDDLEVEVTVSGIYTFNIINIESGCANTRQVEVLQNIEDPTIVMGPGTILTCNLEEFELTSEGSSVGTEFEYLWSNTQGQTLSQTESLVVDSPGTYELFIMNNANGCTVMDQVEVLENIVSPLAEINALGALILDCNNSSALLDGSSSSPFENIFFEWSDINENIISTEHQIEVSELGVYNLLVTNIINGCTHEERIEVAQDVEYPIVDILPPDLINCYNPSAILDAQNSSIGMEFEYVWSSPTGGQLSDVSILNPEVEEAGTYELTILNTINGCEESFSVQVEIDQVPPVAEVSLDDELDCITPTVDLSGDGSSQGSQYTYQWTGAGQIENATSLQATVNTAGEYELIVTNTINGCTSLQRIEVPENDAIPTDLELDLKDITCFGFNDGSIEIKDVVGGTEPFLYSFNGSDYEQEISFPNLGPGIYPIQVIDATGCEWDTELLITEPEQVYVELGPDMTINLGDVVELNALSNGIYIDWETKDELDCLDDCFSQTVSPFETTTYYVEVTDKNGCPAIDEILLRVDRTRAVYIPNAFSPNGDGVNDFFTVYANPSVKRVNKMLIADRWGEIVFVAENFEPEDPDHGWTGMQRDKSFNPGVFVYYAEVEFVDGFIGKYKGDVTLMR